MNKGGWFDEQEAWVQFLVILPVLFVVACVGSAFLAAVGGGR
jgi:hypothetical protein